MGAAAIPAAVGMQVVGGIYGAQSAQQAGIAQQGYYSYLSRQARSEAELTEIAGGRQAHAIQDAAASEYSRLQRGKKEVEGSQRAAAAANGVGGSVTAEDIARDTVSRARLDEMALRFNADSQADETLRSAGLTAFGLRSQAESYEMAGNEARRAADRQAVATLLGTASSVAGTVVMSSAGKQAPAGAPKYSGVSGSLSPLSGGRGMNLQIARPFPYKFS